MARRSDPTKPSGDGRISPSVATPLAQQTGMLALPPADAVIALRVVGSDLPELPLSAAKRTFVLGSDIDDPDVTVKVSSRMNGDPKARESVSRVHLLIQRKGNKLWIKDQGSTNRTFIDDREEEDGEIKAGDTFRVGNVTLMAMDQQMLDLRPQLQWVLGFKAHAYVDETLQAIASDEPLLLIGEAACEQRWLAEQIHVTSARRHKGFAAVPAPLTHVSEHIAQLTLADQGTAFVDLSLFDRLPAPFVKELFGSTYHVRQIVASPDIEKASTQLGPHRALQLSAVMIPSIRHRREDVPRILNSLFRRPPLEKKRDVNELGEKYVEVLKAFDWPDNFDDLRRNAPKLLALIEAEGSKRGAARILGKSHQSVGEALARIGI